jgi:hypothetical protein
MMAYYLLGLVLVILLSLSFIFILLKKRNLTVLFFPVLLVVGVAIVWFYNVLSIAVSQ